MSKALSKNDALVTLAVVLNVSIQVDHETIMCLRKCKQYL